MCAAAVSVLVPAVQHAVTAPAAVRAPNVPLRRSVARPVLNFTHMGPTQQPQHFDLRSSFARAQHAAKASHAQAGIAATKDMHQADAFALVCGGASPSAAPQAVFTVLRQVHVLSEQSILTHKYTCSGSVPRDGFAATR